ncbi:MAG: peroxiredoxin family protein [Henriciella sp.]
MIRHFLAAAFIAGAVPAGATLAEPADQAEAGMIGPMVGAMAPEVSVTTSANETVPLLSLAGEHGVAVVFVRSLDWCPYCKKQAMDLEAAKAPLEEAGWPLVLVSYDPVETQAEFAGDKGLTYAIVSDQGSDAIRAFGLLNDEAKEGSRFYGIPHPAIVFVRTDGTVGAVLREEGYKARPPVDVVTETATLLNEAYGY